MTKADLRASVHRSADETDGQKLLHAIRAWGDNSSNELATRTVVQLVAGNEYVLTAIREWGQACRILDEENAK